MQGELCLPAAAPNWVIGTLALGSTQGAHRDTMSWNLVKIYQLYDLVTKRTQKWVISQVEHWKQQGHNVVEHWNVKYQEI